MFVHDEWGKRFLIAMLARVEFEHKVDQCATEPCPCSVQDCKTCRGDFACPFKIQNAESSAKIDVIARVEVKLRFRSPAANFDVCRFILTNRNAFVRDVWQGRD